MIIGAHLVLSQTLDQLNTMAADYYEKGRYQEAIDFYDRLNELDPNNNEITFGLAMSNYKALNYSEAKDLFLSILTSGSKKTEVAYHYGLLLKIQSNYQKADSVFSSLLNQIDPIDPFYSLAKLQREGCQLAKRQFLTKNVRNYRLLESVNSLSNDFAPVIHPITNDLYISTSRKTKQKQFLDGQYGGFLPDIIRFEKENLQYAISEPIDNLNSPLSESSGSFSKNGKSFYYTYCPKNEQCKIMISTLENNEWSEGVSIGDAINMEGYDSEHPNISATGDTLFFASNRPGGQGGKDIWMSLKVSVDEWMFPINMGGSINTAADEITPFYSSGLGLLIFASDGHAGYGGFDLYLAKGSSFYSPSIYNLGVPFNSPQDDTYFELGLSASNRDGVFNIYQYNFKDEYELFSSFLKDESLIQLVKFSTNSLSLESFRIEDYKGYDLFDPEERDYIDFSLTDDSHTNITGLINPNSVVKLRISDEIEIVTISEEDGSYEFRLLPDTITDFHVKVGDEIVEATKEGSTYNYYHYDFEKIYFDFNSDQLRNESIETLIDLIGEFDVNNIVLVDVHTHADHIGDADYNFELSEKRGLSVLRELNEMGIPFHQMRVFANGEDSPLSRSDSWYSRLFNRRAELVVYTKKPVTFVHPEVFLVRQNISVNEISSSLRIESEKLYEWNGLQNNTLIEGHVLRVFNPNHLTPNLRYLIPESYLDKNLIIYTVKFGDSIESISKQFDIVEEILLETNHLSGEPSIGMEIVIRR